jgi:hypothetical protein
MPLEPRIGRLRPAEDWLRRETNNMVNVGSETGRVRGHRLAGGRDGHLTTARASWRQQRRIVKIGKANVGFLDDLASMTFSDWRQLAGRLILTALAFAFGFDAGWKKAKTDGGFGWFGFWFLVMVETIYTIGRPRGD